MNETQGIKNRATLLQGLLKEAGLTLARLKAIRVISQLDGYRSYNAALHGAPHKQADVGVFSRFVPRLRSGASLHPDVVADYLANDGRHCFYCGSARVYDKGEAAYDFGWDVLVGCQDCGRDWWANYQLNGLDGLGIPEAMSADVASVVESSGGPYYACPHCGDDAQRESGAFIAGRRAYQLEKCGACHESWVELYSLAGVGENPDR